MPGLWGLGITWRLAGLKEVAAMLPALRDQYHSTYQAPFCLLSPGHAGAHLVIRVSETYLAFMD